MEEIINRILKQKQKQWCKQRSNIIIQKLAYSVRTWLQENYKTNNKIRQTETGGKSELKLE